jgi:FkbM family methyltransferase
MADNPGDKRMNRLRSLFEKRKLPTLAEAPAPAAELAMPQAATVPEHARLGFSAYGEDLIMVGWLGHYGVQPTDIRYLDIGAATPQHLNNTYLLYSMGARGLLVEPDPDQAALLRAARPRDVVAQVGVAFDERRSSKLYRFTNRVFNTFSEEQKEFVLETSRSWPENVRQTLIDEVEVELVPVNELITRWMPDHAPHVVSIDVEGVEMPVLRSMDPSLLKMDDKLPSLLCFEAHGYVEDFLDVLGPHGYAVTARTPDNILFRRDPEWVTRDILAGVRPK